MKSSRRTYVNRGAGEPTPTTSNTKKRRDEGSDVAKTYSPPHLKTQHKAFSDDEDDNDNNEAVDNNHVDDYYRKNKDKKPASAPAKSQQTTEKKESSSPRDNKRPSTTKEGGGTPGVDRPPEKVFFPNKKKLKGSKSKDNHSPNYRSRGLVSSQSSSSTTQQQHRNSRSSHLLQKNEDDDTADSVTIDSYLEATAQRQQKRMAQRQQDKELSRSWSAQKRSKLISRTHTEETEEGGAGGNYHNVYHLANDDVRPPSPKHRARLNKWYASQNSSNQSGSRRHMDDVDEDDEEVERFEDEDDEVGHRRREATRRMRRNRVDGTGRPGGLLAAIFGGGSGNDSDDYDDDDTADRPSGSDSMYRAGSADFSADGMVSQPSYINDTATYADDADYLKTKQETAYMSIGLTSVQLLLLCLQLAMCGIATLDINPFVGPYPDAFSEWGGKNAYLMIEKNQWFRLVTPSILHVGILHLLANAFCQLEPIAFFEREWGSLRWTILYLLCTVGCVSVSSLVDPDTIAVGSSGALMGMFMAKLAQVMCHVLFEVNKANQDDMIRLDQFSSVICGLILVSLLSFFTYIDWSGHMGGAVNGFFGGMLFFCNPIRNCCIRFLWGFVGLCGVVGSLTYTFYYILWEAEPADEELADACEYFRYFFPEDYECGCLF